jgi:hypothetical protein
MSGGGDFLTLFGSILEARPNGLGLLWYTRDVFRNFVLKVDWAFGNSCRTLLAAMDFGLTRLGMIVLIFSRQPMPHRDISTNFMRSLVIGSSH